MVLLKHNMTTPDQILQKALEREKEARDFYAGLASGCTVDFVRDLLEKLRNEESKHVQMIQHMISRLESGRDIV
jgi:rubrerythrin